MKPAKGGKAKPAMGKGTKKKGGKQK